MAVDPIQIELTREQKVRLAILAEQEGKDYTEIVDELLSTVSLSSNNVSEINGVSSSQPKPTNLYEAFDAVGAIGCISAPPDLSTNPKHMEGFGSNGNRKDTY